jgi:predicted Na+-dependent transporter
MNQTRIESLIEAFVNTTVGFIITIAILPVVNWICGIEMSGGQMTLSTALFTIVSVCRGYVIRRFFNNLYWIKHKLKRIFLNGND